MRKLLIFFLEIIAFLNVSYATDFTYNGLKYTILTDNTCETKQGSNSTGTLVAGNSVSGNLVIPETVYYNDNAYTVTSIGDYAFYGCTGLTEVTIGNSVTSIGDCAFNSCTGLTEVTIPNSVTSIGTRAFWNCSGLVKSAYPNSISNPFSNRVAVAYPTDAEIEDGIIWGANKSAIYFVSCKYEGDFNIPNSVTSIGDYAFYVCSGLTEVTIGNSVTSIGRYAFDGCSGLVKSAYPNSISNPFYNDVVAVAYPTDAEIEDGIIWGTNKSAIYFVSCKYEGDFNIPNSVTSIGSSAFNKCTGLMEVTIPNSVTSIGSSAFCHCSGLKWIESQANTPPTIQPNTFSDYSIPLLAASDDYKTAYCWKKFTNVAISYTPTGTTFEVDGLKYEIISVNDLTCRLYAIDETVTGENVVIPETVVYKNRTFTPTEIRGVLAKSDSSIKSISIPSSTTTISNGIIYGTTLEKLTVNAPITPNLVYASNIDELVIPSTVTEVSANLSTNNIGKITIEDSETALTTTQFECDTKEVYLGRNVSASTFKNMTSLENVTISDKVTSISNSAFYGCTGLTEVTIPNSVTSIGASAFRGCTGLTEVTIPNSVTEIGDKAFHKCTGLTEVTIPNSVTEIGTGAFWNCSGLTEVNIPNSVTTIGSSAFSGCTSLTEVNIPNSVTTIGSSAFSGCTSLTEVNIPNSVTTIYYRTFENCTGLTEVTIPNSVTEIGDEAFYKCTGLTEVTIPNSVTEIGDYAFFKCTGLTEVTIPNSVTEIGDYAFYGCTGITSLNFEDGEGNLTIGTHVFTVVAPTEVYFGRQMDFSVVSHTALETVEFGENITSIASGAFKDDTAIRTVVSRNATPPTTNDTFSNETYLDGVLYVPEASIEAYQTAAGWKNFWEIKSLGDFSSIDEIAVDNILETITISNGAINICTDGNVRIVAMNGTTVYSGRGNCSVNVAKGIYIVIINGKSHKVAV